MRGEREDDPVVIRLNVRPWGDDHIVASLNGGEPPCPSPVHGTRTRNLLRATVQPRFPSAVDQSDMGNVLFESGEVRKILAKQVNAGRYVRLILDVDVELSPVMWEAALAPSPKEDHPDDLWHREVQKPLGQWTNVAVVRSSSQYTSGTAKPNEDLFDARDLDHRAFVIDARKARPGAELHVRLPTDMEEPFGFTLAESAHSNVLLSRWMKSCKVLHFVGHASPSGLLLDGANVTWELFRQEVLKGSQLRLVMLEACATAGGKPSSDKISFAWDLAQQVPAVLAMMSEIWSDSADLFIESFYHLLAVGHPVDFAVARARRTLWQAESKDGRKNAWMLPVLFLNTPGSAEVPRRTEGTAGLAPIHEPLHLLEPESAQGIVLRRVVAGNSFQDVPAHAERGGAVAVSADGEVCAALVDGELFFGWRAGPAHLTRNFGSRFTTREQQFTLLAVRAPLRPSLEVAVSDDTGTYTVVLVDDGWGRLNPVEGSRRAVAGTFLHQGFLGWDDDGGFMGEAQGSAPPTIGEHLRTIAGADRVDLDVHEVLAVWGRGWDDEPSGLVLARRRGSSAWSLVEPVLRYVAQLGLARSRTALAGGPAGSAPTVLVAMRGLDGRITVGPSLDLTAIG